VWREKWQQKPSAFSNQRSVKAKSSASINSLIAGGGFTPKDEVRHHNSR
jgi:hypothetical protein